MSKKFYLTTAIAYLNSPPHIGFAYEVMGADILARFKRMQGYRVFFLTGSDEHSLNIYHQAKKENLSPKEYCDRMVEVYLETWRRLGISYDFFIRTTSPQHKRAVRKVLEGLFKKGVVYKGPYEGWYCISCESFYREKDLIENKCPIHLRKCEWVKEENYFFRLSDYQKFLKDLILSKPSFIEPEERRNEVLKIIEGGLQDISISRQGLKWGIPFPGEKGHTVYVWVDALINYISGIGYGEDEEKFKTFWPADVHFIGKDILRFHCVIWPALLKALDLPLPEKVFAHGFLTLRGMKISSTQGNIIEPLEILKEYPADVVRYYLFRDVAFGQDGDFSMEGMRERYNNELANDLGNLVRRAVTMIEKYFQWIIPSPGSYLALDKKLINLAKEVGENTEDFMENLNFSQALKEIWRLVKRTNQYVEEASPWRLHKEGDKERLSTSLYSILESLRIIATLLHPFMPSSTLRILEELGLEESWLSLEKTKEWGLLPSGKRVRKGPPLFPRK